MANLDTLQQDADAIHERYRSSYAGRNRVHSDPDALDLIAHDMAQLQERAPADADATLLNTIQERLDLYRRESEAIREVQAGGPDEIVIARISDDLYLTRRRYLRHFAGQDRTTRDLGLLDELRADLRRWRAQLENLAVHHDDGWHSALFEAIDTELRIYDTERREIPKARQSLQQGPLGTALARSANGQFDIYRTHFQDRKRHTRRPALLARVIDTLQGLHNQMVALKQAGFVSTPNDGNIAAVDERIASYRRELSAIHSNRAGTKPADRVSDLAEEANSLFNEYREHFAGKARHTVNPDQLSIICDRLFHISRLMMDLESESGLAVNTSNLRTVMSNLKMYEREHEQIVAARS